MGLTPAAADHNPELQVCISPGHMYSYKINLNCTLCNYSFLKINIWTFKHLIESSVHSPLSVVFVHQCKFWITKYNLLLLWFNFWLKLVWRFINSRRPCRISFALVNHMNVQSCTSLYFRFSYIPYRVCFATPLSLSKHIIDVLAAGRDAGSAAECWNSQKCHQ